MLVPIYLGLCREPDLDQGHAAVGTLINANLWMAVLVSIVHAAAMIAAGGGLAWLVYRYLGLKFLSRSWFNLDAVWAISLILVGTIAMALPGSNPNGGTDEFFINLAGSSNSFLDPQDFTVFGEVVGGVGAGTVVNSLTTATPTNESSANGAFSALPLFGGPSGGSSFTANDSNFPGDATANNFEEILSASIVPGTQNEFLSYSLVANSNPTLVTPTFSGSNDGYMKLQYAAGMTGSATITVKATDTFGASTTGTFTDQRVRSRKGRQ